MKVPYGPNPEIRIRHASYVWETALERQTNLKENDHDSLRPCRYVHGSVEYRYSPRYAELQYRIRQTNTLPSGSLTEFSYMFDPCHAISGSLHSPTTISWAWICRILG